MLIPLLVIVSTWLLIQATGHAVDTWNITSNPAKPTVFIDETKTIEFNLTGPFNPNNKYSLTMEVNNPNLLNLDYSVVILNLNTDEYTGRFNITGIFLGKTEIEIRLRDTATNKLLWEHAMAVKILRPQRVLDKIFTVSVALLVSLIYVNFGCALNWADVKATLRKPIGPAVGLVSQFLFMPLASYGLGLLLFPGDTDMQLGMFFTGVAPAGGASNMWTLLLGGNLHLSVTMTAISTFAAFAMMPLWLFTLGKKIFHSGDIPVPYTQISTYAIALVLPLLIGYLLQKYLKTVAQFLTKILKGFASTLLIFIIVFAIIVNFYLFQLFSWQLVVSGLGLPWLGYGFGYLFARYACHQNAKDSLTIAIETGIQNTGIAIFLLRFTLPQPEADITTIAPVSVATMTPIPLLLLYIVQRIKNRRTSDQTIICKEPEDENQSYQSITE